MAAVQVPTPQNLIFDTEDLLLDLTGGVRDRETD